MSKYLAEASGTFGLVLAGTGAIALDRFTAGGVTHTGISLVFGGIVFLMILAVGKISGAHLNPAVTLGLWQAGLFAKKEIVPYVMSQLTGALAASLLLCLLFPGDVLLGSTLPTGPAWQSGMLEWLMTLLLMAVILLFSQIVRLKPFAAIAIGLTVALEAYFGGPISGASMNPARSIAPAVVSGNTQHLWLYIAGPVLGAVCASAVFRLIK